MKLKELRRELTENADDNQGDIETHVQLLKSWSEDGRYKNNFEDYLVGVSLIIESLGPLDIGDLDYDDMLAAVVETEVLSTTPIRNLFVTFKDYVQDTLALAYVSDTPDDARLDDNFFLQFKSKNPTVLMNLTEHLESEYFILNNMKYFKRLIENDQVNVYTDVRTQEENESGHALFTRVLTQHTSTETGKRLMIENLTFEATKIYDMKLSGKLSTDLFHRYQERIHEGHENLVSDMSSQDKHDPKLMRVCPSTVIMEKLLSGGYPVETKDAFIAERKQEIDRDAKEMCIRLKDAAGTGAALPDSIKHQILLYTIDTLDELWNKKLKVFPFDDDKEARDNMHKILEISSNKRPATPDDSGRAKHQRTSVATSFNMSIDERKAAKKYALAIKSALKF